MVNITTNYLQMQKKLLISLKNIN